MKISGCYGHFLQWNIQRWLDVCLYFLSGLALSCFISLSAQCFCPESQFSPGYSGFRRPKETFPKPNISHLQGPRVYMLKHLDLTNSLQGSRWISLSQHNTLMAPTHPHLQTPSMHFNLLLLLSDINIPGDATGGGDRGVWEIIRN